MFDDELRGGLGAIEDEVEGVKAVCFEDLGGALSRIVINEKYADDLLRDIGDECHTGESTGENARESISG